MGILPQFTPSASVRTYPGPQVLFAMTGELRRQAHTADLAPFIEQHHSGQGYSESRRAGLCAPIEQGTAASWLRFLEKAATASRERR
jgi:hypothetical protein